jgi:hypothetical protein
VQDHRILALTAEGKVASVKLKLKSWHQLLQINRFHCFDYMNEYLEDLGKEESESVKYDTTQHLRPLQKCFENIFHQTIMTTTG